MAKNKHQSFGKDYISKNWQPLAIGILVGFVLRELLVVALLAAIIYAMVVVIIRKMRKR